MPVIKVKPWGEGQGEYVLINEEDFDETVHTRYAPNEKTESQDTKRQRRARRTTEDLTQ